MLCFTKLVHVNWFEGENLMKFLLNRNSDEKSFESLIQSNRRTTATVTLGKWPDDRYIQGDLYIQVNFVEKLYKATGNVRKFCGDHNIQVDHLYTGLLYAGLTVCTSQLCSLVCKHFCKVKLRKFTKDGNIFS